jgi:hypothetical protein
VTPYSLVGCYRSFAVEYSHHPSALKTDAVHAADHSVRCHMSENVLFTVTAGRTSVLRYRQLTIGCTFTEMPNRYLNNKIWPRQCPRLKHTAYHSLYRNRRFVTAFTRTAVTRMLKTSITMIVSSRIILAGRGVSMLHLSSTTCCARHLIIATGQQITGCKMAVLIGVKNAKPLHTPEMALLVISPVHSMLFRIGLGGCKGDEVFIVPPCGLAARNKSPYFSLSLPLSLVTHNMHVLHFLLVASFSSL